MLGTLRLTRVRSDAVESLELVSVAGVVACEMGVVESVAARQPNQVAASPRAAIRVRVFFISIPQKE